MHTIWYKAAFKVVFMAPGNRVGLSAGADERHVVPLEGGTVVALDRARVRQESFVNSLSGVASRWVCFRRSAALAPRCSRCSEREEISRGIASGSSIREIAKGLDRTVSTVSREVARHGGRSAVARDHAADYEAWSRPAAQAGACFRSM